jgi:hypothetical protein
MGRTLPFDLGPASDRKRRVSPVPAHPGEGPLTEPTPLAQACRGNRPSCPLAASAVQKENGFSYIGWLCRRSWPAGEYAPSRDNSEVYNTGDAIFRGNQDLP